MGKSGKRGISGEGTSFGFRLVEVREKHPRGKAVRNVAAASEGEGQTWEPSACRQWL